MSQIVWIARHGNRLDFVHPEWFDTAKHPFDPPLSDDGIIQAQQLANRLKGEGINHIFASPFLRTVQTAHIVAETLDLPLKLDWGLGEWLNVEWMPTMPQTKSIEHLVKLFPRIDQSYPIGSPRYPESEISCLNRSGHTAQRLANEFNTNILLVGHAMSVIGATLGLFSGIDQYEIRPKLCSLVKLVKHQQKWELELNCDTSHLS